MILRHTYMILVLTGLMLTRVTLKKIVNSSTSTFTLAGECSGCFSLKHLIWSLLIISRIRGLYCKLHSYSSNRMMCHILALVIPGESMHELGRRNLITALKLNDKRQQGLPAVSIALVSPVSLCTAATAVPSITGSWTARLVHRCHSIRLPAFIKISVGTINFSATLH